MIIHFVDGPCGSAKTYAAVRHAHRLARLRKKVVLVQLSIYLIAQTISDFGALTPEIRHRAIHGETSDRVIADIIDHLNQTSTDGEVLFITHSAFMRLPYFHRKEEWHVIMDEVPQADWCAEFNIPHTHRLITDCLTVQPDAENLADNRYIRTVPSNRPMLEAMARNKHGDQVWCIFQEFAHLLLSPHWSAYLLDNQYSSLIASGGEKQKLLAFALIKPSLLEGFASATIMGACLKQCVLYHLWSAMGVEFLPHKAIMKGLRYTDHQNGALLTILYAIEQGWSKNFRDKPMADDPNTTVLSRVAQRVSQVFDGSEFVWMGNKDVGDGVFSGQGQRLPNSPYGLNPYQHIHKACVVSALLPPPAHFAFLDALGFDSREVKRSGYWQCCYQAAMRISLRNPDDINPKTVIVMDRATADWVAGMFPGCTVAPLGGIESLPNKGKPGRPRQHDDVADRKRAHRDRFKLELRAALDLINGSDRVIGQFPHLADQLRQQMSEFGCGQEPSALDLRGIGGTVYRSIFHAEPLDFFPRDDMEAFIDGLRLFHASACESKAMNGLISPAIFDPAMVDDTSRGLANIRAIWGIWLDNDGGDLSPDEFARLFPRLRMVIFNSYSSTAEKPRWRVFIPTTVAMPIAVHRAITSQIMLTVNRSGFWSQKQLEGDLRITSRKHHGFDMGKLTPSSLFYLPCQTANLKDSFFKDFNGKTRLPLDPYVWAGYAANHARPEPTVVIPPMPAEPLPPPMPPTKCPKLRLVRELLHDEQMAKFRDGRINRQQAAIEKWHSAPIKGGNAAFFQLGVDLHGIGLSLTEIETMLRQEAGHACHPKERRSQIKSIMRTLSQRYIRAAA